MATGSKVKMFDLNEDNKAKTNVVAHKVFVSFARGTLLGWLIEEGNVSVSVSSMKPGAESVLLYEGNNNDDPPMLHLGDVLKSTTKWPIKTLKAILEK